MRLPVFCCICYLVYILALCVHYIKEKKRKGNKMKTLKFEEKACHECGREFEPVYEGRTPEELEKLPVGERIYCACPVHARYTMAVVEE